MLEAEGIQKWFRRHHVLKGASLSVRPGEVVGLVGENGSGKTTLLRILVGMLRSDDGAISIDGRLGYCPQEPVLFDALSMSENLAYFAAGYGLSSGMLQERSEELFGRLRCIDHASVRVATLSGGTKQKLNLIVALLHEPQLLVLDEPYQGLDYESYLAFWDLVDGYKEQGRSALIVSHMLTNRERLDRMYTMQDGRTVQEAAP